MPHGADLRRRIAHIYSFELGEQWHELGLTFKVVPVPTVPISFEDICISVAYQNVLLNIFFLPHPTRHCLSCEHKFLHRILKKCNTCCSIFHYLFTEREVTHMLKFGSIF